MVIHMLNPEIHTIKGQPSVHPQIEKKMLLYKEKMLTDKATIKVEKEDGRFKPSVLKYTK